MTAGFQFRSGRAATRAILLSVAVLFAAAPSAADGLVYRNGKGFQTTVSAQPCLSRRPAPDSRMRLDCVPFGERVSRLREDGSWTLIRAYDGTVGWAASRYLKEIGVVDKDSTSAAVVGATPCLTRRSAPDRRGMRLDCVPRGTRVSRLREDNGWSLARTPDGIVGWLAVAFLTEKLDAFSAGAKLPAPTLGGPAEPAPSRARVRRIYPAAEVQAEPCLKRRSSVQTQGLAFDCLPRGTVVELLGRFGDQTQVLTQDGRRGWVASKFLAAAFESVLLVTDADVDHVDPAQFVDSPERVLEPAPEERGLEVTKWATSDESAEGLVIVGMIRNMGTQVSTAVTMNIKVYDYEENVVLNQPAIVDTTILMPGQATRFEATLERIFAFRAVEFDTSSVDFDVVDSELVPST